MMETKARRSPRASGPSVTPPDLAKPIDVPAEVENDVESPAEAMQSAEVFGEVAGPAEFASDVATTASDPSVDPLTKGAADFGREAFAALTQSQAALARGLEALSAEMAGLALSGIDTAARAATQLLGIKTLSDAIDVNAGFACSSLDVLVGGSAKLSELGVKLAAETSRPFLTQFGKGLGRASRPSS